MDGGCGAGRNQSIMISYAILPSPVGDVLIVGGESGLTLINFQDGPHPMAPRKEWKKDGSGLEPAVQQFRAYFHGRFSRFRLKLALGGTAFQQQVWLALQKIPYGETVSYGEIAKRINRPQAGRAVGAANGRNPLSIVIPCHRVIGTKGDLVGYGGGIHIKKALLDLERRYTS